MIDKDQIITDWIKAAVADPKSLPVRFINAIEFMDNVGRLHRMRNTRDITDFINGDLRFSSIIDAYVIVNRTALEEEWNMEVEWIKWEVAKRVAADIQRDHPGIE